MLSGDSPESCDTAGAKDSVSLGSPEPAAHAGKPTMSSTSPLIVKRISVFLPDKNYIGVNISAAYSASNVGLRSLSTVLRRLRSTGEFADTTQSAHWRRSPRTVGSHQKTHRTPGVAGRIWVQSIRRPVPSIHHRIPQGRRDPAGIPHYPQSQRTPCWARGNPCPTGCSWRF